MITAKMSYIEYHNAKNTLANGIYEVTESDGEICFVEINRKGSQWYTEDKYVDLLRKNAMDKMFSHDSFEDLLYGDRDDEDSELSRKIDSQRGCFHQYDADRH